MKLLAVGVLTLSSLFFLGCNDQPAQNYTYVNTPQQTQQIQAIQDNGQATVGRACLDNQSRVVDDRYCDQVWIEQQRQLAQQRHDDQMMRDLMLYHFMFGGTVTGNTYVGGVTYLPPGYGYMPYSTYRTRVSHTTVINKTVVVNKTTNNNTTYNRPGQQQQRSSYSPPSRTPSRSYTPPARSYTRSYSGSRRR